MKLQQKEQAHIDYDNFKLTIFYKGEKFVFDLNDGDIGDFWNSFTTKDGEIKDINFYQENEIQEPSVSLYGVKDNQIDTNDEIVINDITTTGEQNNYFNSLIHYELGVNLKDDETMSVYTFEKRPTIKKVLKKLLKEAPLNGVDLESIEGFFVDKWIDGEAGDIIFSVNWEK